MLYLPLVLFDSSCPSWLQLTINWCKYKLVWVHDGDIKIPKTRLPLKREPISSWEAVFSPTWSLLLLPRCGSLIDLSIIHSWVEINSINWVNILWIYFWQSQRLPIPSLGGNNKHIFKRKKHNILSDRYYFIIFSTRVNCENY